MIEPTLKIEGLENVENMLKELSTGLRRKVIISGAKQAAKPVIRAIKAEAPKSSAPHYTGGKWVDPGTLKASITAQSAKSTKWPGVFVGPKTGKNAPNDAWYFRFLVLGTSKIAPNDFIRRGLDKSQGELNRKFPEELAKALDRKMQSVIRRYKAGTLKRI